MSAPPEQVCPNCREILVVEEDEELGVATCAKCGLQLKTSLSDEAFDTREFAESDKKRARIVVGDAITGEVSVKEGNARTKGTNAMRSKSEREIEEAFRQITAFSNQISGAKHYVNQTKQLFKKLYDYDSTKVTGNNKKGMWLAAIVYQSRIAKATITLAEVAKRGGIPEKDLSSALTRLQELTSKIGYTKITTDASTMIPSAIGRLPYYVQEAAKVVAKLIQPEVQGKAPKTIAGASILFTFKLLNITEPGEYEISREVGAAVQTIKSCMKEMDVDPLKTTLANDPELLHLLESKGKQTLYDSQQEKANATPQPKPSYNFPSQPQTTTPSYHNSTLVIGQSPMAYPPTSYQ